MKLNRILSVVLAGVSMFSAQSCLKDQVDVFDSSSSERLQAYIGQTREILTSSEKGWIMEYYPGSGQALGGYAYYLTFDEEGQVAATCELDPENSYRSLYKLTSDNVAVLTFDSYNQALHYFATPSSSEYQAKGGDFEFTITSVSPEKIGLRGKRSGNHYDLYPYGSELTPSAYMTQVSEMAASMHAAIIEGKVGETEVSGSVDFNNRRISFSYADPNASADAESSSEDGIVVVEAPFMYTPEGIKTYEPVEVAGATITNMRYNSANNILTNGSVEFKGKLPEDYTQYADFAGNYKLIMYSGKITANVTLTPDESGKGYIMSGLVPGGHDVVLGYDMARGRLTMNSQVVGTNGSNSVWFAAWSLVGGGNLTWNTSYGMEIVRGANEGEFMFVDNGKTDLIIDSFILWETTSSGSSIGQFTDWGSSQFPYLQTLTRK